MTEVPDNWKKITKDEYLAWFADRAPGLFSEMDSTIEMLAPECDFYLTDKGAPQIKWNPPSRDTDANPS